MSDPEPRLTELEIAFTHQQVMLDELSAVVRAQAGEIAQMTRRLAHLAERIFAAEATLPGEAGEVDRPPPHW